MPRAQDVKLLLDIPEPEALFHFDDYAKVLANAIVSSDPHFTIGIFGPWGKGKTTLLRNVERHLRQQGRDILVVCFDAWRYQRESHMLLPILETLEEAIGERAGSFQHLRAQIGKLAKAFAYSTTLTAGFASVNLKEGLTKLEEETRSRYYGWLEELGKAMEQLRKTRAKARIVFLIDDLDRCLPSKAIEVLEAMKVMLDVEGFVFVLALDETVIEKAIEIHYGGEYGINGRDYIKKLVQMEFTLPGLRPQDIQEYVKVLIAKLTGLDQKMVAALAEIVPIIAEDNPREVKRFINSTIVASAISARAGMLVHPAAQVCFMGLRFKWPAFAKQLSEQIWLAATINGYLAGAANEVPEAMDAVKAILDKHPGLEGFLKMGISRQLLKLSPNDLEQLIFYAGVVEKARTEERGEVSPSGLLLTFSEDARAVLTKAADEARRLHHSYLETEHMLLGISAKASKRTSDALEYLGVSLDKIKSATESVIGPVGKGRIKRDVDLSPRTKRAIEFAFDEARRLNSDYIGSEHFLLGLLRETDGVAASILESLGLTVQRFKEALQKKDFST